MPTVHFVLNGEPVELAHGEDELLLDMLRDRAGLSSVRYCCGIGVCGTCTVLLDGVPASACLLLAAMVEESTVDTAETVVGAVDEHGAGAAFAAAGAFQCSYCIPATALTVAGLLAARPGLTAAEMREQLGGNLCRCGSYPQVLDAVERLIATKE